jgi:hypothetical protein
MSIYALAVQLENWQIFMQAQQMLLLVCIYARIYASGIQALTKTRVTSQKVHLQNGHSYIHRD